MEMRPKKWKALLTLFCFGLIAMPGITAPAKDHTMRRARLHTPAVSGRIPLAGKNLADRQALSVPYFRFSLYQSIASFDS